MPVTLDGHPNAVQAFQELEDPASGWRCGRVVAVVRPGFLVRGHWLAPSALCHRIDQEGERHHHQEPLETVGRF
jgi:hypothetical protein